MLVHSSVSGARQWRGLMDDLKSHFQVRAVNLFGYGKTPPWPAETRQSLTDQARLVEDALPAGADEICLVGHSFGGVVAMKVAARLSGRVAKLVLLEPIPFHLLAQTGRMDAFAEATNLCNIVKKYGAVGEWATAAEKFADYWTGAGTWREMSPDRRLAFSEALKPNFFEWDAVMDDTTPVEEWAAVLPRTTLLAFDPAGVSPTREIAAILRRSCPRLDVQGDCWRWPYGAAGAARCHQPGCEVVSAIAACRRSSLADPCGIRMTAFGNRHRLSGQEGHQYCRREVALPRRCGMWRLIRTARPRRNERFRHAGRNAC